MAAPDFWDDSDKAQQVAQRLSGVKGKLDDFDALWEEVEELELLLEMALEEEDKGVIEEVGRRAKKLGPAIEKLELKTLLSGQYDQNNALLSINPGAGGD